MIESNSLKEIMELGYDVHIECKGKGRVYEMSFEATAVRIQKEGEDYQDYVVDTYGKFLHAVGNTIEDTAKNLLEQIEKSK